MSDDLISKQAAIEILNKYGYTKNMRIHKDILSIPPAREWIPVTERMPEEHGEYLCTVKSCEGDFVETLWYGRSKDFDEITFYSLDIEYGDVRYGDDVIAWMPLPEPYKEEADE